MVNVPFRPAMVNTSVPWPPGCNDNLVDAGLSEKSWSVKVAVTDVAAFIVTLHGPVPEQAPLQPPKFEVELGVAVSVTVAPPVKLAEHWALQLIPEGTLVWWKTRWEKMPPPSNASLVFPSTHRNLWALGDGRTME